MLNRPTCTLILIKSELAVDMLNDVSYPTSVTGPLMLALIKQFLSGWAIYGALELSVSLGFTR